MSKRIVSTLLILTLLTMCEASLARVCKYSGPNGQVRYSPTPVTDKAWQLVECWGEYDPPPQAEKENPVVWGVSPATILPQCTDSGQPVIGVGPSGRARECTRQYCARKEYQDSIEAYAMGKPQSAASKKLALTCITRKEQDMKAK